VRIGLLGDVHTDDGMLARALDLLSHHGVDEILCTGDLADGPGSLDRCRRLLVEHDVRVVRGNHDRWLIEGRHRTSGNATTLDRIQPGTRDYIATLPATRTIATPAGPLLLCHGLGGDDLFRLPPGRADPETAARLDAFTRGTDARWVVNGHVHQAFARTWRGVVFLNAGTVWRKFTPVALVLEPGAGTVTCLRLDACDAAGAATTSAVRDFRQPGLAD
jgi:predicted phosphodiesterase